MQQITEQETKTLTHLLKKCEPGNLPREVFELLGGLMVYTAVEFIPLRRSGEDVAVLLLPRDDNDPVWPSMWHTPGTIVRPTDRSLDDAFSRLFATELVGMQQSKPHFIGLQLRENSRGRLISLEYWLEVDGKPDDGEFYPIDRLPENFIPEQKDLVETAVKVYEAAMISTMVAES